MSELEQLLTKRGAIAGGAHTAQGKSGSGSGSVPGPAEVPEDVFASVSAELLGLKEQYDGLDDEGCYFTVRVLGGEWSIAQSQVPCIDCH